MDSFILADRFNDLTDAIMDAVTTKMEQLGVSSLLLTPDSNHDGNADYEDLRNEIQKILMSDKWASQMSLSSYEVLVAMQRDAYKDRLIQVGEDEYVSHTEKNILPRMSEKGNTENG